MIKLLKLKNPDNFYYFFRHIYVGILCRIPFNQCFSELYIPPYFDLNHPSFAKSRYPLFIGSISTPPNHNFIFRMAYPMLCWSRLQTFWSRKSTLPLTSSPSCIPSTLVAPSHACFFFLNSLLYLFSKYRNIHVHIFSHDSYLPPFF